jgi:hypothetical protein
MVKKTSRLDAGFYRQLNRVGAYGDSGQRQVVRRAAIWYSVGSHVRARARPTSVNVSHRRR